MWSDHAGLPRPSPVHSPPSGFPRSAAALGLNERNAKWQKGHDGGGQRREKRPTTSSKLAGFSKNARITRARFTPVMTARSCSLDMRPGTREVADAECDDQDVEHQHDRVRRPDEQPAVGTESINGDGPEAVPRQPERDKENQGSEAHDPLSRAQGVQPLPRLPDTLGRRSRYDGRPDGGATLRAKCSPRGHLNKAAGASGQLGHLLPVATDASAQATSRGRAD